jgi:transcription initiation factor TFIIB
MITFYKSSIPTDGGHSNLLSESTYFTCDNYATTNGQIGKRRNVEPQSYQTRTVTDYESGEIICSTCGMVIFDKIQSNGPELRNYGQSGTIIGSSAESNAPRKRPSSTFSLARYDKGLYTVIGEKDNDAYGRQLDPLVRYSMHKIRMYDVRTQLNKRSHRNLKKAFLELDKLRSKLGLSDSVIEKTAYLYRKAQAKGVVTGRTTPTMVAASLYIACREMTVPKTLKEIAKANDLRLKTLSKDYRILITELDLKIPNNDPRHCIFKVGNTIPTSEKTKRRAVELIDIISKKDKNTYTSGKDPMGLAAFALYIACANNDEKMSQREIANAAGMTAVTIRSRLKELRKYLDSFDFEKRKYARK